MPVTYTNRKGRRYFLCQGRAKSGKARYYFAKEIKDEPVDEIPEGYKIRESVNGNVYLVKDLPELISQAEVSLIEAELAHHPQERRYAVNTKHDRIIIYEMSGPAAEDLAKAFGAYVPGYTGLEDQIQHFLEKNSQYAPVMQFILSDPERHIFRAQRWCYLGSVDDWIDIGYGSLQGLAQSFIPLLGTEEFFDLY